MKPFRVTPASYSNETIFNYCISRTHRFVENTLGVTLLMFRFVRIPVMHICIFFFVNCLLRRLRGHLTENQNDNLFHVHGRITQNPMCCSLSETHLD
ncbi:hypothetical protein PR048_018129, partial [Dryococelus australis]